MATHNTVTDLPDSDDADSLSDRVTAGEEREKAIINRSDARHSKTRGKRLIFVTIS